MVYRQRSHKTRVAMARKGRWFRLATIAGAAVLVAALEFIVPGAVSPRVVHAAPSVQTEFDLPAYPDGMQQYDPVGVVSGPDGDMWISESVTPYVGKVTSSGTFTSVEVSLGGAFPGNYEGGGLAVGSDGNLWVAQPLFTSNTRASTYGVITRVTVAGVTTHFPLPSATSEGPGPQPMSIVGGPDGNLWFTEVNANAIGRITTSGTVTEFPVSTARSGLGGITAGPDGNLWFVESNTDKIGRITTSGTITEFPIASGAQPHGIVAGPDGNLWFTEYGANKIGRMSTFGTGYTEYAVPTSGSGPEHMSTGPDGSLWFTESQAGKLGQISAGGAVTEWPIALNGPFDITTGPDGNVWYTAKGSDALGRLPLQPCGDLVDTLSSSRVAPGAPETATITLGNCGVPTLTNVTTSTTVTPPSGCGSTPVLASFSASLPYGQSASPQSTTFAAPACVGDYQVTTTSKLGSSTVATTTVYFAVSNGQGSQIRGDFNGDGYLDLAVGDPTVNSCTPSSSRCADSRGGVGFEAGQVTVLYGAPTGLDPKVPQVYTPQTPGMPSQLTAGSPISLGFGISVATGDFNHDGYADLAIGVPGVGYPNYTPTQDGAAVILYGSPAGLSTQGSQFVPNPTSLDAGAGSGFGFSMASNDFNHDGFADLAIGAPFSDVGTASRAGGMTIMYGSASGLAPGQTVITESTPGMPGVPPAYDDAFAWSLASGDFNHDGFPDVAIGVAGKTADIVLYSSAQGVTTQAGQYLQAVGPYAYALAAGDFNGNGYDDLAVGEDCGNMIEIHYGSALGLGSVKYKTAQEIKTTTTGMPAEPAGSFSYFGSALGAGDIKGNGRADLAVNGAAAGPIILYGNATKLATKNSQAFPGASAPLGLGDFNHDGHADLLTDTATGLAIYNGTSTGMSHTPSIVIGHSLIGSDPHSNSVAGGNSSSGCAAP